MKNLTQVIAEYVAGTKYSDMPPEVIRACLFQIVDTIAVGLAGCGAPGVNELKTVAVAEGGARQAGVWGYNDFVPAKEAALVNGAMAHAWDFDANHDTVDYKACVTVVPAAIAASQLVLNELNGSITGKDFVTAVFLGVEIGCRLALGINPKPSHAFARTVGCFASTVTTAKILGLSAAKIRNALGIAFAETGIGGITTQTPSLTKRLGAGIASRAGVWSALLADRGFTGPEEVFSGPSGFYQTYYGEAEDSKRVIYDLGKHYEALNVAIKPYPCCRYTHSAIDGARMLKNEERIQPEEIERVTVWVNQRDFEVVGGGGDEERLQVLRKPRGIVDAQFSIPYAVAVALMNGTVKLEDFTDNALQREQVLELTNKIDVSLDMRQASGTNDKSVKVQVRTRNGQLFETVVDNPQSVDSEEALFEKANNCLVNNQTFAMDNFITAFGTWLHLDEVENISEAFQYLFPQKDQQPGSKLRVSLVHSNRTLAGG